MKLYLLSENDFRLQFKEECAALEKEFFGTYKIGGGGIKNNGFDLDRFLNDQNIDAFADILLRVLTTNELTNDQTAKNVATVEAFTQYDEAKIKDFLIDNLIFNDPQKENELKVLFVVVYAALKEGYFYKVSAHLTDQLLGEWLSTRETGQLRINYNMTDFMPIGNQIHLIVSRYNQDFHLFSCLAKVANYTTRKESELTVRETLIKISDGYIHHHYLDNENFIFLNKSPIFRYNGDSFVTQIGDIGFTFKKIEQQ